MFKVGDQRELKPLTTTFDNLTEYNIDQKTGSGFPYVTIKDGNHKTQVRVFVEVSLKSSSVKSLHTLSNRQQTLNNAAMHSIKAIMYRISPHSL